MNLLDKSIKSICYLLSGSALRFSGESLRDSILDLLAVFTTVSPDIPWLSLIKTLILSSSSNFSGQQPLVIPIVPFCKLSCNGYIILLTHWIPSNFTEEQIKGSLSTRTRTNEDMGKFGRVYKFSMAYENLLGAADLLHTIFGELKISDTCETA